MTTLVSPAQAAQLEKSLRRDLACEVLFDEYHRALYATDASLYQIQPTGVVVPRTTADVVAAVVRCAELGVPIVSRGGGTSLSGQSIGAGLIIDFSKHLNRILELDHQRGLARVEPGVVLDHLNAAAGKHGLQFGPEVATSSRANLGGMIGNNSAGARSIVFGKAVDHVISLKTVMSDGREVEFGPLTHSQLHAKQALSTREGEVYRQIERIVAENRDEILARFPRVIRRVSGYNLDELVHEYRRGINWPPAAERVRRLDAERHPGADVNLAKLIVGAEGTLAVVTEALIHLVPTPKHRGVVVMQFDSFTNSVGEVNYILESHPTAIEMFDGLILRLADHNLEYRNYLDFVEGRPESVLIAEFGAETVDALRQQVDDLVARMSRRPTVSKVLVAIEPEMYAHIWACRKAAFPLLMSIPGDRKPITFVEDAAVAPERLPQFAARFREILKRNGTDGAFYGHASVGCLHIRPLLDTANRDDLERLARISDEVADLVLECGGAMSGEHGDGLARSFLNERLFGPTLYQAFKQVKAAFDPQGILNPGKIVDGPSPIENLRYGANHQRIELPTVLDFSREGGFARAAEACNGSGLCRKTHTGTMCPSFMATGDEEHSTRGRANALRLVLSGKMPLDQLTSQNMYGTFDLCLQCKGCKAECPSNVDVAKMKVEFLHHYYAKHGVPLGVRAMAHVATLNRLGSALAPVSNWLAQMPGAAWLQERLIGVDRRRPLPKFVRQSFQKWFRRRPASTAAAPRGPIVLLDDCLTSYCEPNVNRAAVKVLEAAGYEVHLAGLWCCGRAMISKGLAADAKRLAAANVAKLLPWAERGVPIVGCEPSCILTLADDYLDLVPGEATSKVAEQAMLVDSLLIKAGVELPLDTAARQVVLHGHCHQKALVGAKDTKRALEQVAGTKVRLVDSGCCGMAGSFGYEHYDISMKIGERVLFPAARAAGDAVIVAPGFSCRHQIAHGAGRHAIHPLEFLAEHLDLSRPPQRETKHEAATVS